MTSEDKESRGSSPPCNSLASLHGPYESNARQQQHLNLGKNHFACTWKAHQSRVYDSQEGYLFSSPCLVGTKDFWFSVDKWLRTRLVLIERGGVGRVRPGACTRSDMMITNLKVGWRQILGVFCKIIQINFSLSTPVPHPPTVAKFSSTFFSCFQPNSNTNSTVTEDCILPFFSFQVLRVEFLWKPIVGIPRMRMWDKIRAGNFLFPFQYL